MYTNQHRAYNYNHNAVVRLECSVAISLVIMLLVRLIGKSVKALIMSTGGLIHTH